MGHNVCVANNNLRYNIIWDYHDEKKKEKKKFVSIYDAHCFASA